MADYFTHFSCLLDVGTPDNAARALDLFNDLCAEGAAEDPPSDGFLLSLDPAHRGSNLWMRDDGTGDPQCVIDFVLRCADCTICFGRISGAAGGTCPHCGSAAEHRIVERVGELEQLQTRVALANVPEGLSGQLEQRVLADAADSPSEPNEPPVLTSDNMLEILTRLGADDEVIEERDVQDELDRLGIEEPDAAQMCETLAAAGLLLDLGEGRWRPLH